MTDTTMLRMANPNLTIVRIKVSGVPRLRQFIDLCLLLPGNGGQAEKAPGGSSDLGRAIDHILFHRGNRLLRCKASQFMHVLLPGGDDLWVGVLFKPALE